MVLNAKGRKSFWEEGVNSVSHAAVRIIKIQTET